MLLNRRVPLSQPSAGVTDDDIVGDSADGSKDGKKAKKGEEGKKPDDTSKAIVTDLENINSRLAAAEEKLSKKESELAELKKKEKEEMEKNKSAEERVSDIDKELKALKRENLLNKIALKKGFDADLLDRVRGESAEEIETDIDLLMAKFQTKKETKAEDKGDTVDAAGRRTSVSTSQDDDGDDGDSVSSGGPSAEWQKWRRQQMERAQRAY